MDGNALGKKNSGVEESGCMGFDLLTCGYQIIIAERSNYIILLFNYMSLLLYCLICCSCSYPVLNVLIE